MQPRTAPPREHLTRDDLEQLITRAPVLSVEPGLELLTVDDELIEDISDELIGGTVEHGNYRRIHGTVELELSTELDWPAQRVRPYITLSDGATSARFDLGVYLLSTPSATHGRMPAVFEVAGYDKLHALDTPLGASHALAAGTDVLAAVRQLIEGVGETEILLADEGDSPALPSARIWQLDEKTTTLAVVNELLGLIGYRALWCDWRGQYRSDSYVAPANRATEWHYSADGPQLATVEAEWEETTDLHDVPNVWVFVRDDPAQGAPVEGDGVYTVTNQSDGPASIDARAGRVRRRIMRMDAASHDALVRRGDAVAARDRAIARHAGVSTSPNPLHWHADVVELNVDGDLRRYLEQSWELPLDGGRMRHEWKRLA